MGSDVGWAALHLDGLDFFALTMTWRVGFCLLLMLSGMSEGGITSEWVDNINTTGGGENSHLSSLRNAWGECRGVTGGVFNPSSKGSSDISSEGSMGRKGSLSLGMVILLI